MNRRSTFVFAAVGVVVTGLMALATVAFALNRMVPYQPFIVRSYVVSPDRVCVGADVTARVTRRFTDQVSAFRLTETWVEVDGGSPSRIATGFRPVESNEGELPPEILTPSGRFTTVTSPLVTQAPEEPGVYKVKIEARAEGRRIGLPTSGTEVFFSDGRTIVVVDCGGGP